MWVREHLNQAIVFQLV